MTCLCRQVRSGQTCCRYRSHSRRWCAGPRGTAFETRLLARQSRVLSLCLANCYFAHDSSGFPTLLLFFDAQSGPSCYPLDRHAGPVARTWWRPFPGRGVASPETPAPDRESLPATIAQSIRGGPHPCRLAGALGASNPPSPFRNYTEALDTARDRVARPHCWGPAL